MKFVHKHISLVRKNFADELSFLKPILLFILFSLLFILKGNAQINSCAGNIFDSGGLIANYQNNSYIVNTYCSDNGEHLKLSFTTFLLEENFDFLSIYDGPNIESNLVGHYTGDDSPLVIQSSGTCLTLEFTSDSKTTSVGYVAQKSCVSDCTVSINNTQYTGASCGEGDGTITILAAGSQQNLQYSIDGGIHFYNQNHFTQLESGLYPIAVSYADGTCLNFGDIIHVNEKCLEICLNDLDDNADGVIDEANCQEIISTCGEAFYDDGGPNGNYSFDTSYIKTYCSESNAQIQAIFKSFELDLGILPDTLIVYDGIDTTGRLLGKYFGRPIVTGEQFRVKSLFQSTQNCLTFQFKSGEFGVRSGWVAEILCTESPSTGIEICGNGIDDDLDGFIDEQDADCPEFVTDLTCDQIYEYFIPPVWQMGGNPVVYSKPGILCLSTMADVADIEVSTADGSYHRSMQIHVNGSDTLYYENNILKTNVNNAIEANKGLIIQSTDPLQIFYMVNGYINKNFISVKGKEAQGKSFIAGSQTNTLVQCFECVDRSEHHFVSVMATADDTNVDFIFTRPMNGITSPHSVNLDKGETYLITDQDYNVSVSGVKVRSDQDVVVISGSQHTNAYGVLDDDGGVDMLVPIKNLGTDYVLQRGGVVEVQDYAIVVAAENFTKIYLDSEPNPIATLNAGEFIEVPVRGSVGETTFIHSSKKSAVYHVTGQIEGEVGMSLLSPIGPCIGDKKLQFKRFNMTENMSLQLVIPSFGLSSLKLNANLFTSLNTYSVHAIQGLPGYSSVQLLNADIQQINNVSADYPFQANLLVGDATNTGSVATISSFAKKINILDPTTLTSISQLSLDTICAFSSVEQEILVEGCGNNQKIVHIEQGTKGTVELTDDLAFEYINNGQVGEDVFSIIVGNEFGIQAKLCLQVFIDSLYIRIDESEKTVCSDDKTILSIDSIAGQGPYEYLWSTGETTASIEVSPNYDTYYFVSVTDNRGCEGVEQVFLEVLPSIISEAGPNLSVCHGEIAYLSANLPALSAGEWSGGQGVFSNSMSPTSTYIPSDLENGTSFYLYWTLSGTTNDMCFQGADSLLVTVTDFLEVFAGADAYTCSGNSFDLVELGAQLNSNTITDGTWETNGDGLFMPGNKTIGSFLESTSYVPGTSDILMGNVELTLSAFDPTGAPPCNEDADQVMLLIAEEPVLVCNNHLNIALNKTCKVILTADMVLEDAEEPFDFYQVTLYDESGIQIPNNTLNSSHIDKIIEYQVSYDCGNNSCWGTIIVEDKQIPNLLCQDTTINCIGDTNPELLGFPLPSTVSIYPYGNEYLVEGFDGCGDAYLSYQDQKQNLSCNDGYQAIISRTWTVRDESGNSKTCVQKIFIEYIGLEEVVLPPSYNDIEEESLSCQIDYPSTSEGYPSPEVTGSPFAGNCTMIEGTFTDIYFPLCGGAYKILREWLIFDWCTSTSIQYYQTIKVGDKAAPTAICPSDVTISTDEFGCNSGLYLLSLPQVMDDCSEYEIMAQVTGPGGNSIEIISSQGNLIVADLDIGKTQVKYTITDLCGNSSTCSYKITTIDNIAPTAVCDSHTKVSLNNVGTARLFAESIDDGSYDNCAIEKIEVRKMNDACGFGMNFGPYVDLCCDEIGTNIMVVLRITDIYGNTNFCMTEVELEDKIAPFIEAPDDLTISCTTDYDLNDLSPFGKIAFSQGEQENIVIYDAVNNGIVGKDGIAIDNCEFTLTEQVESTIDCGVGEIRRFFTAIDEYEQQSTSVQTITLVNTAPFTSNQIIWPSNQFVVGCKNIDTDVSVTGVPMYINPGCSSLVSSYDDKLFTAVDSACLLILRTWSVLDMCQFNPDTGEGLWEHIQTIKLNNTTAPEFTSHVQDTVLCTYGACEGEILLNVVAEDDCTAASNLVYSYEVDAFNNGSIDYSGNTNQFSKLMSNGTHRIFWRVQDGCGNVKTVSYIFEVVDCKNPSPYCISNLSTVVMEHVGEVSIWASDYNIGSSDNCSPSEELIYSFSADTSDLSRTFSCSDIENGISQIFDLEMWVTDEIGNQDYCSVQILIEDNIDVCANVGTGTISGTITTPLDKEINDVNINISNGLETIDLDYTTDQDGLYSFNGLPFNDNYWLTPYKNDDILNGVTTLDIILIQKHILGISPLEDPYKLIAADVNNSSSITGTDLIHIRKAILGFYEDFPSNTSWRFVDRSTGLNSNYVFDFDEQIYLQNLQSNATSQDFMGIKIADVNGSVKAEKFTESEIETREAGVLFLLTQKDNQTIILELESEEELLGLQFELAWDPKYGVIEYVESPLIDLKDKHYSVDDSGALRLSYDRDKAISIVENNEFLVLHLSADSEVEELMESISVIENSMVSEWVDSNLSPRSVDIAKATSVEVNQNELMVSQNRPNPFKSETWISIEMPADDWVELIIHDVQGKLVYNAKEYLSKGTQEWHIKAQDLHASGVYYYQIISGNNKIIRKMIKVE